MVQAAIEALIAQTKDDRAGRRGAGARADRVRRLRQPRRPRRGVPIGQRCRAGSHAAAAPCCRTRWRRQRAARRPSTAALRRDDAEQRAAILARATDFARAGAFEDGRAARRPRAGRSTATRSRIRRPNAFEREPTSSRQRHLPQAVGVGAVLHPGLRRARPAVQCALLPELPSEGRPRPSAGGRRTTARSRCSCGCRSRRRATPSATLLDEPSRRTYPRADLRRPAAGPRASPASARRPHARSTTRRSRSSSPTARPCVCARPTYRDRRPRLRSAASARRCCRRASRRR